MKKLLYFLIFLYFISTIIISCSKKDDVVNSSPPQTTINGYWYGDKGQMVSAPSGSTPSAIMKQSLFLLGELDANAVGNATLHFNTDSNTWYIEGNITNPAIQLILKSGTKNYSARGYYIKTGDNITFIVSYYSGSSGNQNTGNGTLTLTDKLLIYLNFPNNEIWKLVFKR